MLSVNAKFYDMTFILVFHRIPQKDRPRIHQIDDLKMTFPFSCFVSV